VAHSGYSALWHLHTWRCNHACGDAIDFVAAAVAGGVLDIGISDHGPFPDGRWQEVRMRSEEVDDYLAAIQAAQDAFPQARVRRGFEYEWLPEMTGWYDELLGRYQLDYLIGACHYIPVQGRWTSAFDLLTEPGHLTAFVRQTQDTIRSGRFAFIAHPDILGNSFSKWTPEVAAAAEDICACAAAEDVPLEMNSYGLRKTPVAGRPGYPWKPFWEVAARHGVRVVLSSDAHRPEDTCAGYADLAAWRDELGLMEADLDLGSRPAASAG
jgi:histidinol-phosphatase (PHP family)